MSESAAPEAAPTHRRRWRLAALGVIVLALLTSPWWGRQALRRMAFFRVRNVEIVGARWLQASDVVARLGVDTTASVWDDLAPLEARVRQHPQVQEVEIDRRLPGTLVVRVTENLPVALVPSRGGLQAVDARGRALPIDPSRSNVDLPIVAQRDTALLRLLADVRTASPTLFARVSEVRRAGREEIIVRLVSVPVRATVDVTAARLAETIPVEEDLARRGAAVAELDLRFRDQVIARLQ